MTHSSGLTPLTSRGISYLDVLPGTPVSRLDELREIHLTLFADNYPYAAEDFARTWREGARESDIIEHQWLLHVDGNPCGEFIFQVNLRRGIISRLFLGLLPEFRNQVDGDWIPALLAECEVIALAEARKAGVTLMAMMSEVKPRHARGWQRLGHVVPDISYQEPVHGNHWREYGALRFQSMTANFLILQGHSTAAMDVIAAAGVKAFLLDYYDVPSDDPILARILASCERLKAATR